MPEREHSNTLKYSKLIVENKQIMEHSKLFSGSREYGALVFIRR